MVAYGWVPVFRKLILVVKKFFAYLGKQLYQHQTGITVVMLHPLLGVFVRTSAMHSKADIRLILV